MEYPKEIAKSEIPKFLESIGLQKLGRPNFSGTELQSIASVCIKKRDEFLGVYKALVIYIHHSNLEPKVVRKALSQAGFAKEEISSLCRLAWTSREILLLYITNIVRNNWRRFSLVHRTFYAYK